MQRLPGRVNVATRISMIDDTKPLSGSNALVTGSSTGIGAQIALTFAQAGANVGIHYHQNEQGAREVEKQICQLDSKCEVFQQNLLETDGPRSLFERFIARFETLNVLVNNAGDIYDPDAFTDITQDAWDKTMGINAKAPFFLSTLAIKHMRLHGGGRIINISSIAARYGGSPQTMHYAAAKGALETFTHGMARFVAAENILINAIQAGFIDTKMHERLGRSDTTERVAKIPVGRAGTPDDIAAAALFLAGPGGDFITGQILPVSGGD